MKAKKSADNNNRLIKTHSSAIQITHKLSLVQHKAWLVLLRNAYQEIPDPNIKKHKIRLSELATYLGYTNNRNDGYFKEILEGLVDTKVSWNVFSKDGVGEWGIASMLAGCRVKGGVVEYDYSTFLREKLYNPKMFALLNLQMLNQFSSKYSLAIYNLCKDYTGTNRTPFIELAQFREFMGLEESEYPTFKSLNRRVIKEPIAEINKFSDIFVKVEYTKEKRRVIGLQFLIRENPQLKFDIKNMAGQGNPAVIPGATGEEGSPPNKEALFGRLASFGLSEKQARKYLDSRDLNYISQNLDVVERECRSGNVKNVSAYTVKALEEDFRPRETFIDMEKKGRDKDVESREAKKRKLAALEKELESFRADRIEKALAALSSGELGELERGFMAENAENIFVMQCYAEGGLKNVMIKGAFKDYAKNKLFDAHSEAKAFENGLRSQGVNPEDAREELNELFKGRETPVSG